MIECTRGAHWWEPSINLLGCILFGIAALAGYLVPSTGSLLGQAAANWTTALGAACFLACAVFTLRTGRTSKSPRLSRIRELEQIVAEGIGRKLHRGSEQSDAPSAALVTSCRASVSIRSSMLGCLSAGRTPSTSASDLACTTQGKPSQQPQRMQVLNGMSPSVSITPQGAWKGW